MERGARLEDGKNVPSIISRTEENATAEGDARQRRVKGNRCITSVVAVGSTTATPGRRLCRMEKLLQMDHPRCSKLQFLQIWRQFTRLRPSSEIAWKSLEFGRADTVSTLHTHVSTHQPLAQKYAFGTVRQCRQTGDLCRHHRACLHQHATGRDRVSTHKPYVLTPLSTFVFHIVLDTWILSTPLEIGQSALSAPSWGRGTSHQGPTKGVTERRLPDGQQWNVSLVRGYGVGPTIDIFTSRMGVVSKLYYRIWQKDFAKLLVETKEMIFRYLQLTYQWEQIEKTDREMLAHMTAMPRSWCSKQKKRHFNGKSLDEESRRQYETMTQLMAPSSDVMPRATPQRLPRRPSFRSWEKIDLAVFTVRVVERC
ncbi:hypothetical protein Taro_024543 [Colocasia esculenta]|uniref:Uncharacterized protein n=1 Tax=Colocasia esculenta TaxID=4460 RepID=A0A843VHS7_COLES|nr:hypothetical protein [Colocasia esculenta]